MNLLKRMVTLTVIATATFAVASFVPAADKEEGFKPLVKDDLSGFDIIGKKDIWKVKDGVIECLGKPNGYLVTKASYRNFTLRFDFRYPGKAGNSGYLIYCTGKPKIWPKCIEVQGHYSSVCKIFPAGGAKGPSPKVDGATRSKVRKPHTEWNSIEIVSKDGALTARLNGAKISQSEPYDLKEGPIGFQSEGAEIHFRNLRIKEE